MDNHHVAEFYQSGCTGKYGGRLFGLWNIPAKSVQKQSQAIKIRNLFQSLLGSVVEPHGL